MRSSRAPGTTSAARRSPSSARLAFSARCLPDAHCDRGVNSSGRTSAPPHPDTERRRTAVSPPQEAELPHADASTVAAEVDPLCRRSDHKTIASSPRRRSRRRGKMSKLDERVSAAHGDAWQAEGLLRRPLGGGAAELPGIRLIASGLPHPQRNNGDVNDPAPVPIEEARAWFAARDRGAGVPWRVRVPAGRVVKFAADCFASVAWACFQPGSGRSAHRRAQKFELGQRPMWRPSCMLSTRRRSVTRRTAPRRRRTPPRRSGLQRGAGRGRWRGRRHRHGNSH